ncbi:MULTISPECIES: hypothetical protein [unclassified Micromonospora]|uniref:hypothetical protein n=1 Tax=unclassified Micromonospora TaxID=2617518 RepID=UPI0033DE50CB
MRRRLAALLSVPLLALPAACAAASTTPESPPATGTPAPAQSYWAGQDELMAAADTVEDYAARNWPHAYTSVSLDLPGRVLLVHRVPTADFDAKIRPLVRGVSVRFVDSAYSGRTLDGWFERVQADIDDWRRRGVTIHSLFWNGEGSIDRCLTVEVGNPRHDATLLTTHYADMSICVRQGGPAVPLTAD